MSLLSKSLLVIILSVGVCLNVVAQPAQNSLRVAIPFDVSTFDPPAFSISKFSSY